MPPNNDRQLGWKAFFVALALLQTVTMGIGWRVYDTVTSNSMKLVEIETRQEEAIIPRLEALER